METLIIFLAAISNSSPSLSWCREVRGPANSRFVIFIILLLPLIAFSRGIESNYSNFGNEAGNCLHDNVSKGDTMKYSHYNIRVEINPGEQFISVVGNLKYLVMSDTLNDLVFNLHKEFVIDSFRMNGAGNYQRDTSKSMVRWLPDAVKIIFPTGKRFHKGDVLDVEFSYSGTIMQWPAWSANVIGTDWVELGLYLPWYPSIPEEFTYRLAVDINPQYNVFAIGKHTKTNDSHVFETSLPVTDLVICASKDLSVSEIRLSGRSFKTVNSTLSEATVDTVHDDIQKMYRFFVSRFGEVPLPEMCLVVSKREKGGGYVRKGSLFLSGLTDAGYTANRTGYRRYLAHEMAHFWWTGAPLDWEDWLNESFAEFSALMLIRELYGIGEYNQRITAKRNESLNTPPIWGIHRNDSQVTEVLYSKGVVLLDELEQKTGTPKFLELCRARVDQKVNTTTGFLQLLQQIAGSEVAVWFEGKLKANG